MKPENLSSATRFFHDSGVNITTEGKWHLEPALGDKSTIDSYFKINVQQWVNEVKELATVATTHPQAAYAAVTHGMASKWKYDRVKIHYHVYINRQFLGFRAQDTW